MWEVFLIVSIWLRWHLCLKVLVFLNIILFKDEIIVCSHVAFYSNCILCFAIFQGNKQCWLWCCLKCKLTFLCCQPVNNNKEHQSSQKQSNKETESNHINRLIKLWMISLEFKICIDLSPFKYLFPISKIVSWVD